MGEATATNVPGCSLFPRNKLLPFSAFPPFDPCKLPEESNQRPTEAVSVKKDGWRRPKGEGERERKSSEFAKVSAKPLQLPPVFTQLVFLLLYFWKLHLPKFVSKLRPFDCFKAKQLLANFLAKAGKAQPKVSLLGSSLTRKLLLLCQDSISSL